MPRCAINLGNGFIFCVTEWVERAFSAQRSPGDAQGAAVKNQLERKVDPLLFRQNLHQILLDLHWVRLLAQIQPADQPLDVRVHNYAPGNSIQSSKTAVGTLA